MSRTGEWYMDQEEQRMEREMLSNAEAEHDAAMNAQDAEAVMLQCIDAIAGLYPALDILCWRAISLAPYKSPIYERISKIHGLLEAACDLARREGKS